MKSIIQSSVCFSLFSSVLLIAPASAANVVVPSAVSQVKPTSVATTPASPVHEYHLKNGLTLLVRENHRAPVVESQLWYKVGSMDELPGKTGLAHMLEHMMYEGTPTYPDKTFMHLVTNMGGLFNAQTGNDFTFYYETAPANHLDQLFKLEADRMQHLSINPATFSKEIEVVKEERRLRTENDPQSMAYEYFLANAYIGSPYQHPVVGWMRDLNHLTVADVENWYKTWYEPSNAVIVVVGDVQPDQVDQLAENYFGKIPARPLPAPQVFTDVPMMAERDLTFNLPAQVPFLMMGYNVPSLKTAASPSDAYALLVASAILSMGDSSRFNNDLIQTQKIASSAKSAYDLFGRLSVLFLMYGVPSQSHTPQQLKQAFLTEVQRLQQQPVSAAELARAKIAIEASHIYQQDSIDAQATELGQFAALGLPWQSIDQFVPNIEAVTPAQIQAVAKKYFVPTRLTTASVFPTAGVANTSTTPPSLPSIGAGHVQ